jgi:regulator of protease activity HflC (stomatin/prohibitin superfamily)
MIKLLNIIAVVVLVIFLMPAMCMERIEPGKVGVRRSLEGGISEKDFTVGYHMSLPFWHKWYQIDGTLHYVEYAKETNNPYEIRTKDGNRISFDLIIPYRIKADVAWMIAREGFADSYDIKVKSTATGVLREALAGLTNLDVQKTEVRQAAAKSALPALNVALDQYHIEATHVVISGVSFPDQYEAQLQNKQYFVVQGNLDEARQRELVARQETDTLEKTIDKDIAIKREDWNKRIEELRSKYELEIAHIQAEATGYNRNRRADADAQFSTMKAEGDLAEAQAEALGQKLRSEALASKAGRTFSAIEAARRFKIGDIQLNSRDPAFLRQFGGMAAWREFFLGE